jgi:hypothetical protein
MRRHLTPTEITEARLVFGGGLRYAAVWVSEGTYFPNFIADIGQGLHSQTRTTNNAVSIGDTCYFPITLDPQNRHNMGWLIHELTHQWQFQRMGWRYLPQAVQLQIREGKACYDYRLGCATLEDGLIKARAQNMRLTDFNLEQQGEIAMHYYLRLKEGKDVGAWKYFVEEFAISSA